MTVTKILETAISISLFFGITSQLCGCSNDSVQNDDGISSIAIKNFQRKGAAILRRSEGGFLVFPESNRVLPLDVAKSQGFSVLSIEEASQLLESLRQSTIVVPGRVDSIQNAGNELLPLSNDDLEHLGFLRESDR